MPEGRGNTRSLVACSFTYFEFVHIAAQEYGSDRAPGDELAATTDAAGVEQGRLLVGRVLQLRFALASVR